MEYGVWSIEVLGLVVSLLVSLSRACSRLNVQRNKTSDGPTFYGCNSDVFRRWQIGRSLETQLCVQYVSDGYSGRVSISHT